MRTRLKERGTGKIHDGVLKRRGRNETYENGLN